VHTQTQVTFTSSIYSIQQKWSIISNQSRSPKTTQKNSSTAFQLTTPMDKPNNKQTEAKT